MYEQPGETCAQILLRRKPGGTRDSGVGRWEGGSAMMEDTVMGGLGIDSCASKAEISFSQMSRGTFFQRDGYLNSTCLGLGLFVFLTNLLVPSIVAPLRPPDNGVNRITPSTNTIDQFIKLPFARRDSINI